MTEPDEHPARAASQRSMAAVEAGDRDGWLALFAGDALVEDPIGPSPLDETGQGRRGLDAIGELFDAVIGPNQIRFAIRESYAAGSEVANVGSIITTFLDGGTATVEGVFTYRIDDKGKIAALRAYWDFSAVRIETASS